MGERLVVELDRGRRLVVEGEFVTLYSASADDFGTMHYRKQLRQRMVPGVERSVVGPEFADRAVLAEAVAELAGRVVRLEEEAAATMELGPVTFGDLATEGTESTKRTVDDVDGVDRVDMGFEGPVVVIRPRASRPGKAADSTGEA